MGYAEGALGLSGQVIGLPLTDNRPAPRIWTSVFIKAVVGMFWARQLGCAGRNTLDSSFEDP
jgi:hypothetical protein